MDRICLLSERDCQILRRPFPWRLLPPRYDRDLGSGRPVREFVALARLLRERGFQLHPVTQPPRLDGDEPLEVIKVGKCNLDRDSRLMRRYAPRNRSEWNERNLEMVDYFDQYVDLGRRTWTVNLRHPEGQARLRALLAEHGPLFVKSIAKGHAGIVQSYERALREFGDLRLVDSDFLRLLVSEVVPIRSVQAVVGRRRVERNDEWRHYVYRGRRVVSSHAFECDLRRTPDDLRPANVARAEAVAESLRGTDFATSYVLDTATLADGRCVVVEANFFFSSGIYDAAVLEPLADALAGGRR